MKLTTKLLSMSVPSKRSAQLQLGALTGSRIAPSGSSVLRARRREGGGSLVAYLIFATIATGAIAAIAGLVSQNMQHSQRRQDMVNALQFAQAGAALACKNVATAYTNTGGLLSNLTTSACGSFSRNDSLTTGSQLAYERTITSPFTNQSVQAQLVMSNVTSPSTLKIFATATVGRSTQTAQINVEMQFGPAAAIISTAQGNSVTGVSKSNAQDGNVVVDGSSSGNTRIDGGIISNGNAVSNYCAVDAISDNLFGTSSQIPDFTSPGSPYQLFDFNRFIAVADMAGTHYTNAKVFETNARAGVLEGIIVVDCPLKGTLPTLDDKTFPSGINVRGTLVFNFIGAWDPLDKIVNTATMNINAADLSGLVATNPATYTSGYPPTYTNSAHNPINYNISTKGYQNFTAEDDLPALMFNNAILDLHGDINICGVVYSSSFMEIENKQDGQIQYFRGALIGGGGIYVENGKKATSIVSFDANALGNLATAGGRGKMAVAVYRK